VLTDTQAGLLDAVDAQRDEMVALASELVRIPSVGGTDAEHEAQARMAEVLQDGGLEVDHWPIDLDTLQAHPDFPGSEVHRTEAWGLVGRLPGTEGEGDAPTPPFRRPHRCGAPGRPGCLGR
jgi:acetylornithine deacetylase